MGLFDIFRIGKIKAENDSLKLQLQELHADEYFQVKARLDSMNQEIADNSVLISQKREELSSLTEQCHKTSKQLNTQTIKISRYKELYKSIEHVFDTFISTDIPYINCRLNPYDKKDLEDLVPSVSLQFHSLDVKELRKAYKENEKQIDQLMELYKSRYTTKSNKSIYSLVVIALKAELQNVLYNLKYDKLEKSIEDIKTISAKYLKIAAEGNQSIAGTLTKFVGEMEYLFINAVKIEYSYYSDVVVKKEEITNLQNGKAGNVYIISNLGSFGKDVFKIGMTRRLDPQDRVNELGSASVPFKFDVHSFIFSEDAVGLEKKLHDTLNDKRLNKVNLRKEFFKIDISELEELVSSIDPTAEFNTTMLAEEFRQSEELLNN